LVLLCAASAVLASPVDADHELMVNPEVVSHLSTLARPWTSNFAHKFATWTVKEFKKILGTHLNDNAGVKSVNYDHLTQFVAVPDSFDARTKWPNCIHPVRNQLKCGSCWAFSASEVLSDRICIASGGKTDVVLSPEDMVECDSSDKGCQGGMLPSAWSYLENTGIVSDDCLPYTSGDGSANSCPNKCSNGAKWQKYKAKSGSTQKLSSEQTIQLSLMTYGPVQTGFLVYKDFPTYSGGVYTKSWYRVVPLGGHAVKIVGWGEDAGVKYWTIANSWGEDWGEKGFFRIRRGTNECTIEAQAIAGLADA
jgi:cathepsin B